MKINEPVPEGQVLETPVAPETSEQTPVEDSSNVDSLASRIAKFHADNQPKEPIPEDFKFNSNDVNNIQDPVQRQIVEDHMKSNQKAFNEKFQQLAELRKESENANNNTWTPERVQALTQDPEFLSAAQQITNQTANAQSDEEYLTDTEKQLKSEVSELRNTLNGMKNNQTQQQLESEHDKLETVYGGNYDKQAVDSLRTDLISGKVQANNESLWKVYDYEASNDRAYKMGLQDGQNGVRQNVQGMSISGQQVVATPVTDTKPEGQTNKQFWQACKENALRMAGAKAAIKQ